MVYTWSIASQTPTEDRPAVAPTPVPSARPAGAAPRPHGASALLGHLARLMRAQSESALEPLGLRPRHLVALTILREHSGGTQQALAGLLSMDRTNLVGLLNELETDGLIARRRDADDRRRHLVELTALGGERLTEAEAALTDAEDAVLGALDADQRVQLRSLLQQATAGHGVDCGAAAACESAAEACAAAAADDDLC